MKKGRQAVADANVSQKRQTTKFMEKEQHVICFTVRGKALFLSEPEQRDQPVCDPKHRQSVRGPRLHEPAQNFYV